MNTPGTIKVACLLKAGKLYKYTATRYNEELLGYHDSKWDMHVDIHIDANCSYESIDTALSSGGYRLINVENASPSYIVCTVKREEWMTNIAVRSRNTTPYQLFRCSIDERMYHPPDAMCKLELDVRYLIKDRFYADPNHRLIRSSTHVYTFVSDNTVDLLCYVYYKKDEYISIPVRIFGDFSPKYHINIRLVARQLQLLGYTGICYDDIEFSPDGVYIMKKQTDVSDL